MTITNAEGKKFAADFVGAFNTGFAENNHSDTLKDFLAPTLSWDWTDGTKGQGKAEDLLDIFSKTWGALVDSLEYSQLITSIDTEHNKIFLAIPHCGNITGGIPGESNLVFHTLVFMLTLDDEKKVTHWGAIWDNNLPTMKAAIVNVMTKLGADLPPQREAPVPISVADGEAYAARFMEHFTAGFKKNNHIETLDGFFADSMGWDWADGSKAEGASFADLCKIVESGWGLMVDSFVHPEPNVVVDTDNSVITIAFPGVINITGGFEDENNSVINDCAWVLTLNEEQKCVKWGGYWDNQNPEMLAQLTRIGGRLQAAAAKTEAGTNTEENATAMVQ